MGKCRIVDTRFRILKKGKIALACALAIGGLSVSTTTAHATDYFTNNISTAATYTDVESVNRYSADATNAATRNSTVIEEVVFKPTGVRDTYIGIADTDVNFDDNVNGIFGSQTYATYRAYTSEDILSEDGATFYVSANGTYNGVVVTGVNDVSSMTNTITFAAGAKASDIYKANGTDYYISPYQTSNNAAGDRSYFSIAVASSSYTANLIFTGSNEVLGSTDIDGGNITINGGTTFAGTVEAGSIDIRTSSPVIFNSHVDLTPGTSDTLAFYNAGNVTLNNGLDGNVDYQGNNGYITLSDGDITGSVNTSANKSGTLIFTTSNTSTVDGSIGATAALKEIQLNGNGTVQVNDTTAANVNFNAAATLNLLTGSTYSTNIDTTSFTDFKNYAGTINVYDGVTINSNIISTGGSNGASASVSNTVNFRNDAIMNGNIGSSTSRIANVNIGMNADATTNMVDMTGDIYATQVKFYDDDTLLMRNGKNITGNVVTHVNGEGILTLAGGTQSVNGQIGEDGKRLNAVYSGADGANSSFSGDVFADTIENAGTGTSNFAQSVEAATINIRDGISNFVNNVVATTTYIASGIGNFNTNGTGTTTTRLVMEADSDDSSGHGLASIDAIANLHNGLTGNIYFDEVDATVNVWAGKNITGKIDSFENDYGYVNFKGDSSVSGHVFTYGINIGTDTNNSTVTFGGNVIAGDDVWLHNDATMVMASGKSIGLDDGTGTGDEWETNIATMTAHTGTLTLLGGNQTVDGIVGEDGVSLKQVNAGATAGISTFNGMVYADTLRYSGNGTVILNGINGSATEGMVGTVDFVNGGTGELQIGDGVDLTVGTNGIQFANANAATLRFNGSSVVNGVLGGDLNATTRTTNTFKEIYAGQDASTVTFKNDVYVMQGTSDPATFYVDGTGTVNFEGDLNGDLVFLDDGVVNVSNGKSLIVTGNTVKPAVTFTDSEGTINFLGATTLYGDLGEDSAMLKSVTFNKSENNVTQTINKNIFADTVTIGGVNGTTAIDVVDVTGVYDYAGGTNMYAFTGGTTANIDGNITLGGNLVIANATTAVNFGKSHVEVGGNMLTNGSAMSFVVNTNDINDLNATSTSSGSARVTVGGNLTMSGTEKIIVNYLGSLANNGSYTLIEVDGVSTTAYDQNETGLLVADNSFSIDTRVATDLSGNTENLIVYADRTGGGAYTPDQNYIVKSSTQGSYSNNAAAVLGGIAAAGTQTGDMVEVIQKLDIDSFGYGNTEENLANQMLLLTPVVNNSITLSTLNASTLALNSVSGRVAELRGFGIASLPNSTITGIASGDDALSKGVWAKVIGTGAEQDKVGQYDGYKTNSYGMAIGVDKKLDNDVIIGLAFGYTNSNIEQQDLRAGDESSVKSYQFMAYASKEFGKAYLEGTLAYGMHDIDSTRSAAVGQTAKANIDAKQYSARIEAGYRFDLQDKASIIPFASFDYARLTQDAYSETGAGALNLNVDEVTTDRSKLGLGLRLGKQWGEDVGQIQANLKLGVYQYFGGDDADVTAQFAGGGAKFVTPGVTSEETFYNAGLGFKYQVSKTTNIGLNIDYDRSSDGSFNGYSGTFIARKVF